MLPDNVSFNGTDYIMSAFGYGYVDNLPNSETNSAFDIDWAVKSDGTSAGLDSINFVQNGVIGCYPRIGELSTEVTAIYNLNSKTE